MRKLTFTRGLMAAAVAGGLLAGSAIAARAEEEAAINSGSFSLAFQSDFTTAYFFRGILQERDGLIWEPSLGLNWKVYESEDGPLKSATIGFGTWASVQTKDTATSGSGPESIYETDYYPSVSLAWAGGLTTGFTYYMYTSPNGAFSTVEEAAVSLAYDDSTYLGAFALKPTATFYFETQNSSLGSGKGKSAVFSIAPSKSFSILGDAYPITVTLPVAVGVSTDDFYDTATSTNAFGYASMGLNANVPLAFLPKRFGTWSVTNGFNVMFLGDALEGINQGDAVYPVWTSSLVMSY